MMRDNQEQSGAHAHETGGGQGVNLKQETTVSDFKIKEEAQDKKCQ